MVAVHTPSSPFVIGCGLPSISPMTFTSLAFGARKRSVIVRSAFTCGDTIAGGRAPPRPACGADAGAWTAAGACAKAVTVQMPRIPNVAKSRFTDCSLSLIADG
jgi:hypothetical protein